MFRGREGIYRALLRHLHQARDKKGDDPQTKMRSSVRLAPWGPEGLYLFIPDRPSKESQKREKKKKEKKKRKTNFQLCLLEDDLEIRFDLEKKLPVAAPEVKERSSGSRRLGGLNCTPKGRQGGVLPALKGKAVAGRAVGEENRRRGKSRCTRGCTERSNQSPLRRKKWSRMV